METRSSGPVEEGLGEAEAAEAAIEKAAEAAKKVRWRK